jgi:hypothetical protein
MLNKRNVRVHRMIDSYLFDKTIMSHVVARVNAFRMIHRVMYITSCFSHDVLTLRYA